MTRTTATDESPHGPDTTSPPITSSTPGRRLAGYRVLRRAPDRHGGRVFQAVVDGPDGNRSSVTIVVFEAEGGDEPALRLIERLERLGGECVPRVLDVCLDDRGATAVVLDFCGDTVSTLVSAGARLEGGELVTLVAPILATLLSMHDRGFVHGAVSASSIAIGSNGRPLLLGCERAEAVGVAGDRRDRDRRAGDDIRAFADLVEDLGDSIVDPDVHERARRSATALRAGASTPFAPAVRSAAEVRLFEIADPAPLAFAPRDDPLPDARAERAGRSLATTPGRLRRERAQQRGGRTGRGSVAMVHRSIACLLSRTTGLLGPVGQWVSAGGRRRRVVSAAASAVALALIVAVALPTGQRASPSTDGSATADGRATGGDETGSVEPATGVASTAATDVDRRPQTGAAPEDALAGMRGVLDVVASCLVVPADGCWTRAFEPGSDLLAAVEAAGADELPRALRLPVEALDIAEREDFGDARLITLTPSEGTTPASVLMVRTEAGWRIREVFET